MLIPIRCYTCLAPIEHKWERYREMVNKGKKQCDALDIMGMDKICCRKFFTTHVSDLVDTVVMLDGGDIDINESYEKYSMVKGVRSCHL